MSDFMNDPRVLRKPPVDYTVVVTYLGQYHDTYPVATGKNQMEDASIKSQPARADAAAADVPAEPRQAWLDQLEIIQEATYADAWS